MIGTFPNCAFVMPRNGTLSGISTTFINNGIITIPDGGEIAINFSLYVNAGSTNNVFTPITTATLFVNAGTGVASTSVSGGNTPLAQGQMVLIFISVYTISGVATIIGYFSAGIAIA